MHLFGKKIGCSSFTLSVIEDGYYLPFISPPTRYSAKKKKKIILAVTNIYSLCLRL